jgi:DNA invertase Pin-like site-specific DNA recombinase
MGCRPLSVRSSCEQNHRVTAECRRESKVQCPGGAVQRLWAVRVFTDRSKSSRVADRPQWLACLDCLRASDRLVIRKLDRIAGSEVMAIQTSAELHDRGVQIKSVTEPDIDTTTPMGRALFGFVALLAQLRVDTIRENTQCGLAHARSQSRPETLRA